MQIIIVGCGNVGVTLTAQLSGEGHDITIVDTNAKKLHLIASKYDVKGVV